MTNNLKFNMFAIHPDLRNYILSNKDFIKSYIDELDIDTLYINAETYNKTYDVDVTPWLTKLLYNINIDPLDYLTKVPKSFMDSILVEMDLILPENITAIGEFAFAGSWVKSISIPTSCEYFDEYIFYDCRKLNYIYYKGTYDDFNRIRKEKKWRSDIDSSLPVWVICTDKKVKL